MSIKAKLKIHKKLGTEVLVTPPLNMNVVGSQIILHYKLDKNSSISMNKSRLVAQVSHSKKELTLMIPSSQG